MKADTAPLLSSVEVVDGEADLEELTASSEAAVETGATLAARQADALEAASQELLETCFFIRLECRASGLFSWRQGSHISIMEGMLTCCPL